MRLWVAFKVALGWILKKKEVRIYNQAFSMCKTQQALIYLFISPWQYFFCISALLLFSKTMPINYLLWESFAASSERIIFQELVMKIHVEENIFLSSKHLCFTRVNSCCHLETPIS